MRLIQKCSSFGGAGQVLEDEVEFDRFADVDVRFGQLHRHLYRCAFRRRLRGGHLDADGQGMLGFAVDGDVEGGDRDVCGRRKDESLFDRAGGMAVGDGDAPARAAALDRVARDLGQRRESDVVAGGAERQRHRVAADDGGGVNRRLDVRMDGRGQQQHQCHRKEKSESKRVYPSSIFHPPSSINIITRVSFRHHGALLCLTAGSSAS